MHYPSKAQGRNRRDRLMALAISFDASLGLQTFFAQALID